jgi:membrane-associated phospholipid phosphatase
MYILHFIDFIGSYSIAFIYFYIIFIFLQKQNIEYNNEILKLTLFIFLNSIVNILLKFSFRDPRPINIKHYGLGYEYGMPSAHAQIVTFLALYVIYYMNLSYNTKIVIILIALSVYFQRYYFNYHTIQQIIGGIVVGYLLWILYG